MKQILEIKRLLKEREKFRDRILRGEDPLKLSRYYTRSVDNFFVNSFSKITLKSKYALIARGGYGRREMSPYSDIDLLIIYEDEPPHLDNLLYPLWDANLEVGYTVLSRRDAMQGIFQEFTNITSMLDGRFLAGNREIFRQIFEEFFCEVSGKNFPYFFNLISEGRRKRKEKYGIYAELLEPNLKNSCGGLRDVHEVFWVARALTFVNNKRSVYLAGIISREDIRKMLYSYKFIFKLRCLLHSFLRKKEDLFTLQVQGELAKYLYPEMDKNKGVRTLMYHYYSNAHSVEKFTSIFLGKILNAFMGIENPLPPGVGNSLIDILYWIKNRQIEGIVPSGLLFNLKYFRDEKLVITSKEVQILLDIFSHPGRVKMAVEFMLHSGILTSIIPSFKKVINLYQYDVFHHYTVDFHTLLTIKEIDEILLGNRDILIPAISHSRSLLNDEDIKSLYLSALFHDIGKGEGRNHSLRGAEIAKRELKKWNFPQTLLQNIVFLVENHLKMSEYSQKRDLHDHGTLKSFAGIVGNQSRLNSLLLLTVADMRSSGPDLWNEWKGALLNELYFKIYDLLEIGEYSTHYIEQMIRQKKKKIRKKISPEYKKLYEYFDRGFDERYFVEYSSDEILEHFELFKNFQKEGVIVQFKLPQEAKHQIVTVLCRDRHGLLSDITGTFTLCGLDISSARIKTHSGGFVIDQFVVNSSGFNKDDLKRSIKKFNKTLPKVLKGEVNLYKKLRGKKPPLYKIYPVYRDLRIIVDNEISEDYTVIEIRSPDFPGLLWLLTSIFSENGIEINVAKIYTEVDLAVDTFYVTNLEGKKLSKGGIEKLKSIIEFEVEKIVRETLLTQ